MTRPNAKYNRKRRRQGGRGPLWLVILLILAVVVVGAYIHYKPSFSMSGMREAVSGKVASILPALQHKPKAHASANKLAQAQQEVIKPIHFDFYDELPKANMEVAANSTDDEDLSEPEETSSPSPMPAVETIAPEPAETPAPAPVASPVPAPGEQVTVQVAKNEGDNSKVEQSIEQELAADLTTIKANENSSYILQVSVFHNYEAANRYRSALASAGLKVDIVKVRKGREIVYQLQQGPYRDLNQLKVAKKRLSQRGVACNIQKAAPYNS